MLSGMRVGPTSPMRPEACAYLRVCALGAPAATLWLVLNGIFRGLGDTRRPPLTGAKYYGYATASCYKHSRNLLWLHSLWPRLLTTRTPLLWALVFTALNAVLDPFFIFVCGFRP